MILELVPEDSDILFQELPKFDFSNPPVDPIQLSKDLAETMLANNGIGLSANQVGLPYRVFVIKSNPIIACFNPYVVDDGEEELSLEEGCLSYPDLFIKIKRKKTIKVRYTEPSGQTNTRVFDGLTARIFLHEYDHLNGVNFIDRATSLHKEMAFNKRKKIRRLIKK